MAFPVSRFTQPYELFRQAFIKMIGIEQYPVTLPPEAELFIQQEYELSLERAAHCRPLLQEGFLNTELEIKTVKA